MIYFLKYLSKGDVFTGEWHLEELPVFCYTIFTIKQTSYLGTNSLWKCCRLQENDWFHLLHGSLYWSTSLLVNYWYTTSVVCFICLLAKQFPPQNPFAIPKELLDKCNFVSDIIIVLFSILLQDLRYVINWYECEQITYFGLYRSNRLICLMLSGNIQKLFKIKEYKII